MKLSHLRGRASWAGVPVLVGAALGTGVVVNENAPDSRRITWRGHPMPTASRPAAPPRVWYRQLLLAALAAVALIATTARTPARAAPAAQPTPTSTDQPDRAAAIVSLAREAMATYALKAVIVRVTVDGEEV